MTFCRVNKIEVLSVPEYVNPLKAIVGIYFADH